MLCGFFVLENLTEFAYNEKLSLFLLGDYLENT